MNLNLGLQFVYVTEQAAIAAARTMGQGNRKHSDHVAVEAMRARMDTLQMDATIVIGEGERDKAPMLYVGEKVGALKDQPDATKVSIAVDPLEGTNLCATGSANAIAVLAASEMGGLLQAPAIFDGDVPASPYLLQSLRHAKQEGGELANHEGLVAQLAELVFDEALHDPHGRHHDDDGEHAH